MTTLVTRKWPNVGDQVMIIFLLLQVTTATVISNAVTEPVFELEAFKAIKIKGVLTGCAVAMVPFCVTPMIRY